MSSDLEREKYSSYQWLTLCTIASIIVFCTMGTSIQAPFYPSEAEKKGATATEHGLVFGIYELTCCFASPLFGKIVNKIGSKRFLTVGAIFNSIAIILFGFLDLIPDRWHFIMTSIFLRILEALGTTAATVGGFTLIGIAFPNDVATLYGILETCFGAGFIIGPTLGGIFYSIGGFQLPFVINGFMCGIVAIVVLLLPDITPKEQKVEINKENLLSILKIPSIIIDTTCSVTFALNSGFYAATLKLYLDRFNLSPAQMSLMFVISGGTFTVLSPLAGKVADKYMQPKTMLMLACTLMISSLFIIAPLPCIPSFNTLILPSIALFFNGTGLAVGCIAMIVDSLRSAKDTGFPDGAGTYGLVNGIWTCGFSFGGFIGPSAGGYLYDTIGFQYAALCMTIPFFLLILIILIFNAVNKMKKSGSEKFQSAQGNGEVNVEIPNLKSEIIG